MSLHQNYSKHQSDLSEYHYTCHFQQDENTYRLHSYRQMNESFNHVFESIDTVPESSPYTKIDFSHPALEAHAEQMVSTLISDIQKAYLEHAKSIYDDYNAQKCQLAHTPDPHAWYEKTQSIVETFSASAEWMPDNWFIGSELSFMRSLAKPKPKALEEITAKEEEKSEKKGSKSQRRKEGKKERKRLFIREIIRTNNAMYAKSNESPINKIYCKQFVEAIMQAQKQLVSGDTLQLFADLEIDTMVEQTLVAMKSSRDQLPIMAEAFTRYCEARKQGEKPPAMQLIVELTMKQTQQTIAMGDQSPPLRLFQETASALGIHDSEMKEMENSGGCRIY